MDTRFILNPNHLGEELRDQVFVRHNKRDLGGFNSFVLLPEFIELSSNDKNFIDVADIFVRIHPTNGDRAALLSKGSFSKKEYIEALACVRADAHVYGNDETLVAWYWEGGKGMLFFAHGGKAVINTDSRRESGWQWVSW